MTIAVAWVRTHEGGAEELVFCTDSRLAGGKRFDHAQKIFRFDRTDVALCFAGRTDWAYPMIVALINAVGVHVPSQTRALTLPKFKTHVINVLDLMQSEVHTFAENEDIPDVTFLLGGYDWWQKCFRIWRLTFDKATRTFRADERTNSNGFGGLGKIEIAGDDHWVATLRDQLKHLAQDRYGRDMRTPPDSRFNLEPFEIIRDLLKASRPADSIGGAPQLAKVYQYLNSTDVGVFWPNARSGRLYLCGRPLLDYERATIRSVLDPDALVSTWTAGGIQDAQANLERARANDRARRADDTDVAPEPQE